MDFSKIVHLWAFWDSMVRSALSKEGSPLQAHLSSLLLAKTVLFTLPTDPQDCTVNLEGNTSCIFKINSVLLHYFHDSFWFQLDCKSVGLLFILLHVHDMIRIMIQECCTHHEIRGVLFQSRKFVSDVKCGLHIQGNGSFKCAPFVQARTSL